MLNLLTQYFLAVFHIILKLILTEISEITPICFSKYFKCNQIMITPFGNRTKSRHRYDDRIIIRKYLRKLYLQILGILDDKTKDFRKKWT